MESISYFIIKFVISELESKEYNKISLFLIFPKIYTNFVPYLQGIEINNNLNKYCQNERFITKH